MWFSQINHFLYLISTNLTSLNWALWLNSFSISLFSFLSFVERFFSISTVSSYFWIPFKTIPQYLCSGFIFLNPDSHLWEVSLKTEIDSPIDWEVVFLLESFDGFQVLFIQIDRGLSFWWFVHDLFSPVGNKWDIRVIPIYMRFTRPQWIAEVFCDWATTIIYIHIVLLFIWEFFWWFLEFSLLWFSSLLIRDYLKDFWPSFVILL